MRKLIVLIVVVAIIGALAKLAHAKKAEWYGLTEGEVRDKLDSKISDRMPQAKKVHMQDAIVNKMRVHGALRDEDTEAVSA